MAKCPYCARPLRMGGLKCRACRRFVLRRAHVVILILIAVAAVIGLLELIAQLTPPPLKGH
ncbi:MAG TPA: hypothetical protein VF659_02560 [Pyrinomonadaceae bacterium]